MSLLVRFYDPLGLLSPIVIHWKVFLQVMCGMKMGWDQPLSGELLQKWHQLVSSLQEKQSFCYPPDVSSDGEPISFQLCGFCDASCKAYAAVVYLLLELQQEAKCATRVASLWSQTTPRSEAFRPEQSF